MKKILFVVALMLVIAVPSAAVEDGGKKDEAEALKKFIMEQKISRPNPHNDFPCKSCHGTDNVVKAADGSVPIAFGGDLKKACYTCHDTTANIHPVGQLPSMKVPSHLPLDNGRVSCNTCHDMHLPTTKNFLLRGFADGRYTMRTDLCIDCHGASFVKKNPHVNQKERGLCVFCHQTEPTKMDNVKTVRFRYGILKTCNFCHNVAEKNHPVNVDKDINPPGYLPRDLDGSVTCATCHNPHGTTDTLHFLRREYIVSLEASRNYNPHINDCLACHKETPAKGTPLEKIYAGLKYGGNVGLLCNSCHGTHGVHPVDIKPAPGMHPPDYLPLDSKGRIYCLTCHELGCGKGGVSLRLFDKVEGSMKRLCYSCHDEKVFSQTNPHKGIQTGEGCLFCHERQPDPETDTAETVSFISSKRLICLRCHDRSPHPAGREHLVVPDPDFVIPADMPLEEGGSITCITCHNPHIGGEFGSSGGGTSRLRRPIDRLCDACHTSKY
jgi:predicted CXXCH cytochrome family protein